MRTPPNIYDPEFVTSLFDEMSKTYGVVNTISSFGFCVFWRKQCAKQLEYQNGDHVVDLMSGMAELSITIHQTNPSLSFESIDLSSAMCELARKSVERNALQSCNVSQKDALDTELDPSSVDAVVSTFGLKTFSKEQLEQLAAEVFRILKSSGQVSFLEISVPRMALLRIPYMFYLKYLIPVAGRFLMGNPDNYRLLGVYTEQFQSCEQAIEIFRAAGLDIEPLSFFFGCATGFRGKKPDQSSKYRLRH